jgi:hypothetical protein
MALKEVIQLHQFQHTLVGLDEGGTIGSSESVNFFDSLQEAEDHVESWEQRERQ